MGWETEHQTPEVITKEILITLIEKGHIDSLNGRTFAETVGEMYNRLLKMIKGETSE